MLFFDFLLEFVSDFLLFYCQYSQNLKHKWRLILKYLYK